MIILYILAPIACFFVLINFIGLFFPRLTRIHASIIINEKPELIFPEIAVLSNFVTWDPWSKRDPNIHQSFEGNPGKLNSKYSWKGNKKVKEGSMTISNIEENQLVEHILNFGKGNPCKALFKLVPIESGTEVFWGIEMNMGKFPMSRIIGSLIKGMLYKDFIQGLESLKMKIENQNK
ncbi:MAG: SRPBCC family protein [Flavobacteriia bacterium]|nr:SRPBCC family protein [Flavobacteriia bacterium]